MSHPPTKSLCLNSRAVSPQLYLPQCSSTTTKPSGQAARKVTFQPTPLQKLGQVLCFDTTSSFLQSMHFSKAQWVDLTDVPPTILSTLLVGVQYLCEFSQQ